VKLTTGVTQEMASDPKVGCAVALLQSMLALIDKGDVREAHLTTGRRSSWLGKWRGARKVPRYERRLPRAFPPELLQAMNRRSRPLRRFCSPLPHQVSHIAAVNDRRKIGFKRYRDGVLMDKINQKLPKVIIGVKFADGI
jgi:hypothetical protein